MPKVVVTSGTKILQEMQVEATSPRAIVEVLHPESKEFPTPTLCIYEGKPLLRKFWDIELALDAVVVFSEAPLGGGGGDGGKNPLATIGMIIVSVIAAVVTWGVSTYLQGLGMAAWAASALGGLAGSLTMMAGSMLIGALSPTPSLPSAQSQAMQNEEISPTYSISDSTNRARLYQAEPEGFGRMKIVPDVVAQTYYRYVGKEFFIFAVYGCGRGEYNVEQLFFGDTVFWQDGNVIDSAYSNVELEFVPEGGAVTLFPDNVETSIEVAGIELKTKRNGGQRMGPYAASPAGSVTDTLVISYTLPQGVWTINSSNGNYVNHTVSFAFYYRKIDDNGNPSGEPIAVNTFKTITVNDDEAQLVKYSATIGINAPAGTGAIGSYLYSLNLTPNQNQNAFLLGTQLFVWTYNYNNGRSYWVMIPKVNLNTTAQSDYIIANLGVNKQFPQGTINYTNVSYILAPVYETVYEVFPILFTKKITSNSRQTIRETQEIKVPLGRYEVAAEATFNGRNDGRTGEQIIWEQLFSILPGTRAYKQSCIAVKIMADNTLSQEASKQFKVLQTRKLPLWSNGEWSENVPTSSLAAAISHVCKSSLGGKLTDRQIDLAALWAIDADLAAKGWDFNYWLDGTTLMWPMVQEFCSSCLVTPRLMGTTLSFIQDKADRPVKYDITPYHIIRGSFSVQYITWSDDTPDDVIIEYLDKNYGYAQKDVRAILPTSESLAPTRRNTPSITNRAQAHGVGVHLSACNRWRRIETTFDVGGVGRFMFVGDVFTLKHPRMNNLYCAPVQWFDAGTYKIYAEKNIKKPVSDAYYVGFTLPSGQAWGPVLCTINNNEITLDVADYTLLLQQGFVPLFDKIIPDHTDGVPTIFTVYTSKTVPERMLVKSVKPKDMYTFTITAVQDNPNVYAYDIPVPPLDYVGPTGGGDIYVTMPVGLSADIVKVGEERTLILNWLPVTGALSYKVDHQIDDGAWTELGKPFINAATYTVAQGVMNVRVQAIGSKNTSDFATLRVDTEMEIPPAPLPRLALPYTGATLSVVWDAVGMDAQYKIAVLHQGIEVYNIGKAGTSWQFTPLMQVDAGGPWRTLHVNVSAINTHGESSSITLAVEDVAPTAPQEVEVTGANNSITVSGDFEAEDVTGWIVARVTTPHLTDLSQVIESKIVTALPVTFTGIDLSQANYIAVAQKDAFFDVSGDIFELNYAIFTVGS